MPFQALSTEKPGLLPKFRRNVLRWIAEHAVPESVIIMFTAVLVGAGAGLGSVFFRWLIEEMQHFSYERLAHWLGGLSPWHLLIIPTVGGAIVGPMIYRFAREAKGHGVPEVMEAVALRGGRIRPQVALIKALASAVTIGSGGSAGSEGPIAQIGAGLGSTVGQWLKLSDERVRNLVACGAAGGIAAIFNAPIAGALFALEIILGQFHAVYFGAVVISAVVADIISFVLEGEVMTFAAVPQYTLNSPWELLLYALLGLFAAIVSVAFSRLLYLGEDLFEKIPLPEYVKPALGGLLLGLLGLFSLKAAGYPLAFGVGYDSIDRALLGELTLQIALLLLLLKLVATILTLGSGGSGGVFAPSLFMGAMLGEAFGRISHQFFPAATAPSGAYALVGMAAFFSGAAHAPATAILIVFEMTRDYRIILPLMLATVISTIISRVISPESIYTLKLKRRGVHLQQGQDIDVMQGVTVGEAMTTELDVVQLGTPLEILLDEFARTHHHGFPVVDEEGLLAGVVSIRDLERARQGGSLEGKTVADIATTRDLLLAHPYEPMWKALHRLGVRNVSRLPVVEHEGSRRLVGVVRRSDIIQAYDRAIALRAHQQHRAKLMRLGKLDDTSFVHLDIAPGAPAVGKRVSELELPQQCLLIAVRRNYKLQIAHGQTRLQAGDRVTLFADDACLRQARRCLTGEEEKVEE
ncbi:MAG: chloride channel protein [Chloroflexia bacterium]|nr:chloride channel protein [Chloroflexia bacterium]